MSYMAFSDIQPRNIVVAAMAVLYCAVAWSGPDAERIKKECVNFREDKMLGFDRSIFDFEGCSAWVVEPKAPAADGRWVWCMEWPTAFQDRVGVRALLEAGYRWVTFNPASKTVSAGNQNDEMIAKRRAFQKFLVEKLGFAPKCGLIGMSWGGYYSVRYASTHPECVCAAYLDAPLLDFSTLKGFDGDGNWKRKDLAKYYPFITDTYIGADDPYQSVNRAEPIAKAGIPLLILYGGKDVVVPPEKNCMKFAAAFEAAGGELVIERRSGFGHHPHGVEPNEVQRIVNFFDRAYAPQKLTGRHHEASGARAKDLESKVRESLASYVERGEIAGVVSVLSDADYNESWECLGWADAENKVPMRPDTMFAVFSMTKTFTGCAIMIAVDRGILKMDDRVEKYLPEFRGVENKVTIRDCMCHITGIDGGSTDTIHTSVPLREQARTWALKGECRRKIGEKFVYGNSSIAAAAACLEVAAGVPYEQFLKENVLDPLGMKDTTFTPDEDQQRRMVKAYTTEGGPFRPAADRCNGQLKFPVAHRIYPMPSAGLYSTPADMIRFSQMLAHHGEWKGRRIVSRKAFDEIWAVKQTPENIEQPYTVGAWLYGDWFGHEGAMRTDQRANLKTGHSRVFFIQTENKAGKAFFDAKTEWHRACDRFQKMEVPFSDELVKTHENDRVAAAIRGGTHNTRDSGGNRDTPNE